MNIIMFWKEKRKWIWWTFVIKLLW